VERISQEWKGNARKEEGNVTSKERRKAKGKEKGEEKEV